MEELKNNISSDNYFDAFKEKFKAMGLSNEQIKIEIKKLKDVKLAELKRTLNKKYGLKDSED